MTADAACTRLLVGYEGGFLRLFDVTAVASDPWSCLAQPRAEWRAHSGRHGIASATCVRLPSGVEAFITAGGLDVKFWTLEGHFMCLLAQLTPWPAGVIGGAYADQDDTTTNKSQAAADGGSAASSSSTVLAFGW
jgi:hypothetical protein